MRFGVFESSKRAAGATRIGLISAGTTTSRLWINVLRVQRLRQMIRITGKERPCACLGDMRTARDALGLARLSPRRPELVSTRRSYDPVFAGNHAVQVAGFDKGLQVLHRPTELG